MPSRIALGVGRAAARTGTRILRRLAPPPKLTVSEWADQHRYLSAEASAEPGKWDTGRAEYQRQIMDAISDPRVEMLVVMASAQVGKTEIVNNLCGYHIHQDPAPILVVQPSVEMGETWSKDRLAPMLRDSPSLKGRVADSKSRSSGNTVRHKTFAGGHLTVTGANSAAGLASRPIRILCCDEVDRYDTSAGSEGDPVNLAVKRTATFWNRKIVLVSTPLIAGQSRIERAFLESDQRRFWVPCPHCDHGQVLRWAQVKWDNADPRSARYQCEGCEQSWSDAQRWASVRKGWWQAEGEFRGIAGFHLSELYSPWRKLSETVGDFLKAKNSPDLLKTWINTALGETWQQKGEAPEWRRLYERREDYRPDRVPADALVLTAGLDVQKDRVEIYVWGWGADRQSWLVDLIVIPGNPFNGDVWDQVSEVVQRSWVHESSAEMRLMKVGADTGFATTQVEAWARRHAGVVIPVKGATSHGAPVFAWSGVRDTTAGGKKPKRGLRLGMVGGHLITMELYGFLALDPPTDEEKAEGIAYPAGYVHLNGLASEEVCKQMVGDQWLEEKGEWKAVHAREALDCWKYARAVCSAVGMDRWAPSRWRALRASFGVPVIEAAAQAEAEEPASGFEPGRPMPAHLTRVNAALRPAIRSRWMD
ncbi:hypothetical protein BKE38_05125 [Pseudoroseomonas deserti]|uniref:Terminase n=1 Tax=Teichococcus deserti TaxID=1817963 RepID=A0A1V2H805_9PROT|nr:phage terminase large subunit family protein [Pseudoroseomonas deserti]ONG56977.1 hypothetical protein BKE38_05125 [Pseudoroseomonas deserti]